MARKKGKARLAEKVVVSQKERANLTLRKTLDDLVHDLVGTKNNPESVKAGESVKATLQDIPTMQLLTTIEDPESELRSVLPINLLQETEEGRAYLEIIADIADIPDLSPRLALEERMALEAKKDLDLASTLSNSMVNDIPDDIKNLAVQLQQELELPDSIDSFADLDMQDLFTKVSQLMDQKTKNGEIDISKLQSQSRQVLEQAESNPLFQTLANNPDAIQDIINSSGFTK
jgi:hypothetical protein